MTKTKVRRRGGDSHVHMGTAPYVKDELRHQPPPENPRIPATERKKRKGERFQ